MELKPEDLGQRRAIALMRRRAGQIVQGSRGALETIPAEAAPRPLGFFGKLWMRGTGLSVPVAAATVEAAESTTKGMTYGLVFGSLGFWIPGLLALASQQSIESTMFGEIFALAGAVMSSLGLCIPQVIVRNIAVKPLALSELDALLDPAVSAKLLLEIRYLNAVKDALIQPIPAEAAPGVRAALRAMGDAIDRLPRQSIPPIDSIQSRAEAQTLLAQAAQEADPVVAASRKRQAEAILRSVEVGARAETMQRRAAALRDELTAQAQSLRLGLTAFQSGTGDIAGLTQLADTVRGVATEANALSDARAEVEGVVTGYVPTVDNTAPPLRLIQG